MLVTMAQRSGPVLQSCRPAGIALGVASHQPISLLGFGRGTASPPQVRSRPLPPRGSEPRGSERTPFCCALESLTAAWPFPVQWAVHAWALDSQRGASSSAPDGAPPRAAAPAYAHASPHTTSVLRNIHNGAEIFLVGTAHVSRRSAEEVREVIDAVRPHAVLIELCPARAQRLRSGQALSDADFLRDALGSLFKPGSSVGQQLFKVGLQGMYRALRNLGLDPGGEFKAAMEAAAAHGARVICGDRDVQETFRRLAATVRVQDVLRMLSSDAPSPPQHLVDFFEGGGEGGGEGGAAAAVEARVEAMKTRGMAREMSDYLRRLNPALAAALIDERDAHLVQQLAGLRGRVVGVVGLAHLDGIERRWAELQAGGGGAAAR
jgi:hypothetical protein